MLPQDTAVFIASYKAEHLFVPHDTDFTAFLVNQNNPSAIIPYDLLSHEIC